MFLGAGRGVRMLARHNHQNGNHRPGRNDEGWGPNESRNSATQGDGIPFRTKQPDAITLSQEHHFNPETIVILKHTPSGWASPTSLVIEHPPRSNDAAICFSMPSNRKAHIRIDENGNLGFNGGQGLWARFYILRRPAKNHKKASPPPKEGKTNLAITSPFSKNKNKKGGDHREEESIQREKEEPLNATDSSFVTEQPESFEYQFLNFGHYHQYGEKRLLALIDGKITNIPEIELKEQPGLVDLTWFKVECTSSAPKEPANSNIKDVQGVGSFELKWDDHVSISDDEKIRFRTQGFLILRGCIATSLITNALQVINSCLGDPAYMDKNDGGLDIFKGDSGMHPDVLALYYKSKLWTIMQLLLGIQNVETVRGAQCALRFPSTRPRDQNENNPPPIAHNNHILETPENHQKRCKEIYESHPHPPNTQWHIDGMNKNEIAPFSLLVGIALSPQRYPFSGNLHVFPQSIGQVCEWIKVNDSNIAQTQKPALQNSIHCCLEPGDVVIAHPLLAHRIGSNYSCNIRYQTYFRIRTLNHQEEREKLIEDPWYQLRDCFQSIE